MHDHQSGAQIKYSDYHFLYFDTSIILIVQRNRAKEESFEMAPIRVGRFLGRRSLKATVQFERCFRLMEHISVISCIC